MHDIITKSELDDFFEVLKRLIQDLEICISNIQTIIFEDNNNYAGIHTINNFLGHYVYLAYAYSSLSIYKMFKSEEKRSFIKMFNKLEHFKYSQDLKEVLENNKSKEDSKRLFKSKIEVINEIKDLKDLIIKEDEIIALISNRRLTFYAHYDPDKKHPPEKLNDLKKISEVSKQVYDRLYGRFYNSSFLFSNYYWTIRPVIDASNFVYDYYKRLEKELDEEE